MIFERNKVFFFTCIKTCGEHLFIFIFSFLSTFFPSVIKCFQHPSHRDNHRHSSYYGLKTSLLKKSQERQSRPKPNCLCVESKNGVQVNLYTKQKSVTDAENKLMVTRAWRGEGKDKLGDWK